MLIQPIAADDVAAAVAQVALGSPVNGIVEVAGPDQFRLDELIRELRARHDPREVSQTPTRGTSAPTERAHSLPGEDARLAPTHYADWLNQRHDPAVTASSCPRGSHGGNTFDEIRSPSARRKSRTRSRGYGLRRGTVRVVLPRQVAGGLAEERHCLCERIGHLVLDIQHAGSTAVPGLAAKPIIDIAVAVASPADVPRCRPLLVELGYLDRGDRGREGGYVFVKERTPEVKTHHLHLVVIDDPQWANYLRFRDRLRANAALRAEYASLKRQLQERFADDRQGYTEAKGAFIRRVLEQ